MSKKKSNKTAVKSGANYNPVPIIREEKKKQRRPMSKKMRLLILISLIAGILVGALGGVIHIVRVNAGFNYMEAKLSRYVELSPEALKNVALTVRVDKPTEADVNDTITALLVEHKYRPEDATVDKNAVTANGSVVEIFYSGYLKDEKGERQYFSGGSNLSNLTAYELIIGSGSFVPGFESGLIGLRPSDTVLPTVSRGGTLAAGDVVYLNLVGYHPNGSAISQYGIPVTLTPEIDATWGEGFYDLLVGSELGDSLFSKNLVLPGEDGDFMYTNIRSLYKTEGGLAHTVEAYFPLDYGQDALNGRTAYFDVYMQSSTAYSLPALTDAFFTDTVGILPEKLEDYEGASLVEKYKSYVRQSLEEDYDQRLLAACEESFWVEITKISKVKRVPAAATQEIYEEYMESLKNTYEEYLSNAGITEDIYPFKTFAKEYFKLEDGQSYKKKVREMAEQTAGEKMIFFYAIEVCGVMPSESELQAAYEDSLLEYAKMNTLIDESYYEKETDPEKKKEAYDYYLAELNKTKEALLEIRGEEYFLESAYYNYGFKRLLGLAKITYVGKGHQ